MMNIFIFFAGNQKCAAICFTPNTFNPEVDTLCAKRVVQSVKMVYFHGINNKEGPLGLVIVLGRSSVCTNKLIYEGRAIHFVSWIHDEDLFFFFLQGTKICTPICSTSNIFNLEADTLYGPAQSTRCLIQPSQWPRVLECTVCLYWWPARSPTTCHGQENQK